MISGHTESFKISFYDPVNISSVMSEELVEPVLSRG